MSERPGVWQCRFDDLESALELPRIQRYALGYALIGTGQRKLARLRSVGFG